MIIRKIFRKSKPEEIVIEVTDNCNLDCSFCFNNICINSKKNKNELSTERIKKVIDNIACSAIRRIRFSGGEPLIREDIFVLMEHAKSKGLRIWLNTNATLLDKEKVRILSRFVENVLVSLNAFDSISEYKVTNKYLFNKKLRGIKLLKDSNIKVIRCGTVATGYNIQNLEKIYDLIKRLMLDYWELYRPMPTETDLLPIDNNDIAVLIEKLLKINKEARKPYKIYNALPFCCYDPEKVIKVANGAKYDDGHARFVVDKDGMAKPMYYLLENMGDMSVDSVMEIWNKKFMKDMRTLQYVPAVCKDCFYVNACKGGSRFVSRVVGGDYLALDYLAQPYRWRRRS